MEAHFLAYSAEAAARVTSLEQKCAALEHALSGQTALAGITRQAAGDAAAACSRAAQRDEQVALLTAALNAEVERCAAAEARLAALAAPEARAAAAQAQAEGAWAAERAAAAAGVAAERGAAAAARAALERERTRSMVRRVNLSLNLTPAALILSPECCLM